MIEPIITSCSPEFFKRCIFFIISLFCRCRKTFFKHHITSIQGMRSSFLLSRPWASGSAHWPRTSSAVDGRFSWVSKGVRVASGDLKMQRILKHLTEPTGERQHPFGTRLCLQSLVCYTLVPADAEKGLREVPASTCSAAEGCADGRGS